MLCEIDGLSLLDNQKIMKYIFKWSIGDGYTYECTDITPFECDDITKFIYDLIESIQNSINGVELFGIWIKKDDIDNIEHSIFKLEDWFNEYKMVK